MKNIAIDIDDTITDTHNYFLKIAYDYDRNFLGKNSIIDETKIVPRSNEWTKEEMSYFLEEYFNKNTLNIPLIKDSDKYIRLLKKAGYNITIITGRGIKEEDNSDIYTKEYLDNNNIPYNNIILKAKDKYTYIDSSYIFIDDSIKECEKVYKNCTQKVIMIETSTNKEYKNKNIIKLKDWESIYNYIKTKYYK